MWLDAAEVITPDDATPADARRDVSQSDAARDVAPTDVLPDGCVSSTVGNCCGVACEAGAHASSLCVGGACVFACATGYGDCDSDPANGCEVDLNEDDAHCAACGQACVDGQACAGGRCQCPSGETPCAGRCTNLQRDAANCGACGAPCAAGRACLDGACVLCAAGQTLCGGVCVDLQTSAANCGGCGVTCAVAHNSGTCVNGRCTVGACDEGYADCDLNTSTGCEAALQSDPRNCGSCGFNCSVPSGTPTCVTGRCSFACSAGRGDCNRSAGDGCEVELATNTAHCGACGNACSFPHTRPTCLAGVCVMGPCEDGYADCDGMDANGCETHVAADQANCGACRNRCDALSGCSMGACVCVLSLTRCGSQCVSLSSDVRNCGACGVVCGAGQSCQSGRCG